MLGVNNYGNREIACTRDNKNDLSRTFWEIYITQAVLTLVLSVGYVIYVVGFVADNKVIYLIQALYGGQDGSSDHVGIVENGRVYTIEGNSGDSCRQNSYPIGYYEIYGYGTPAY